jgi:hypothetical protein
MQPLLRSCAIAAAACAVAAAPAAAQPLTPFATATLSVKITSHPAAFSRTTTAAFAWRTSGTGTVSCRLDAGSYAKCSKKHSYSGLADGAHTFTVRIKTRHSSRSAVYRWMVDTVSPTDPIVSGGSSAWTNATVTITASGSTDANGVTYESRRSLNGGAWSASVNGPSAPVTAAGTTWVEFRAVDKAGNASAWLPAGGTAAATAAIDKTAPTTPVVVGGSAAWSSAPSVTITPSGSTDAGGSGLGSYEYRTSTDGGATWGAATAAASLPVSAEGETQVEFRSTDLAGNVSAWSAAALVRLDRTAPAVTVSGGAAAWSNAASVLISASATDAGAGGVTYAYRTSTNGGASWSGTVAGSSVSISATGQTLVEFQATDAVGNVSAWPGSPPAGGTVWLDRTAPSAPTSVTGGSLSWQKVPSVTISASGAADTGGAGLGPYQYRTSTDGGATWSAAAAAPATISADGTTLVQMRAADTAGNVSAWAPASNGAANTVMIDNTPPTLPAVAGGSSAWQSVPSVTITASGSTDAGCGFNHYESRTSTDGGTTWSAPVSAPSVTVSAEGSTTVEFRSVDNLGSASAWTAVTAGSTADIDRTAPAAPGVSGGSLAWSGAASMTLTGSGTDPLSGIASYQYRTSPDGGTTWPVLASGASAVTSAEGDTTVEFRAIDKAGNVSAWSAGAQAMLDRSAPTVPTVSGGSTSWTVGPVMISASASVDAYSGLAGYEYRTSTNGGSTWSATVSGPTATISAQGTTLVEFRSVDNLAHRSAWSAVSAATTAKIDTTPPSIPTASGGNYLAQRLASETVTASGSTDTGGSGLAGYEYRTSSDLGSTWSAAGAGGSVSISAEGNTLVQFRAFDGAGNYSAWAPVNATAHSIVNLDRTPPTLPTVSYTAGGPGCSAGPKTLQASGSYDPNSGAGFSHYEYTTNGGATVKTGTSMTVSASGTTTVGFRAVDAVGNASAWVSTSVCVS